MNMVFSGKKNKHEEDKLDQNVMSDIEIAVFSERHRIQQ